MRTIWVCAALGLTRAFAPMLFSGDPPEVEWERTFEGRTQGASDQQLAQTSDGGYLLVLLRGMSSESVVTLVPRPAKNVIPPVLVPPC